MKDKAFILIVFFISSQYLVLFLLESITKKTYFCNVFKRRQMSILYIIIIIYESQNRKGWWYAPRYGCCLLPVHYFFPGYCIYWFWTLNIHQLFDLDFDSQFEGNRGINRPSTLHFHCACAKHLFLSILMSKQQCKWQLSSLKISLESDKRSKS